MLKSSDMFLFFTVEFKMGQSRLSQSQWSTLMQLVCSKFNTRVNVGRIALPLNALMNVALASYATSNIFSEWCESGWTGLSSRTHSSCFAEGPEYCYDKGCISLGFYRYRYSYWYSFSVPKLISTLIDTTTSNLVTHKTLTKIQKSFNWSGKHQQPHYTTQQAKYLQPYLNKKINK